MDEKKFLANFAKILGAESTFEELEQKRLKEERMLASLSKSLGADDILEDIKKKEEQLIESMSVTLSKYQVAEQQAIIEQVNKEILEVKEHAIAEATKQEEPELPANIFVTAATKKLAKEKPNKEDIVPPSLRKELDYIKKSITDFHRFAQQHSQMGGGGEVNLRYLDDVARNTISDGLYLRYNEPTKKFIFDRGHYDNFYGAFQSTVTQNCGASTATALTYNQVDFSYGVTVTNNSQVVLQYPGLYNAQFSVQLTNSGTAIDSVYIWLRQNGVDVVGSAGKIDVPSKHGNSDGALLIGWNFYINSVVANEYFEFMWFTPDETHITIPTLPAQAAVNATSPAIPSTASVVLTVSPVKIN